MQKRYFCVQCERLQGGLQKIAEASEQLAVLNDRLAVQKVAVAEKSEACEIMLEEISTGTVQATEKKSLAESKGKEIEEQNVVIAKEKVTADYYKMFTRGHFNLSWFKIFIVDNETPFFLLTGRGWRVISWGIACLRGSQAGFRRLGQGRCHRNQVTTGTLVILVFIVSYFVFDWRRFLCV